MHEVTRDFLVSIAAFATVFGIVYVIVIPRYRERMAMLEKGMNPSEFNRKRASTGTLKAGMLCVGIAIGALSANVLSNYNVLDLEPAYFSMTILFGGLSLILNFIVEQRINR